MCKVSMLISEFQTVSLGRWLLLMLLHLSKLRLHIVRISQDQYCSLRTGQQEIWLQSFCLSSTVAPHISIGYSEDQVQLTHVFLSQAITAIKPSWFYSLKCL